MNLLPCPFCGANPTKTTPYSEYSSQRVTCPTSSCPVYNIATWTDIWNTRAQLVIPREVGEKMYEKLKRAQKVIICGAFGIPPEAVTSECSAIQEALQLAQSYGLEKNKQNEKETK